MNTIKLLAIALILAALAALLIAPIALAQSEPPGDPNQTLIDLVVELLEGLGIKISLTALAVLLTFGNVLVNVLKQIKWKGQPIIPDQWGGLAVLVVDVLAIAIVAIAGYFDFDVTSIGGVLDTIGRLLLWLVGMFAPQVLMQALGRKAELPLYRKRALKPQWGR